MSKVIDALGRIKALCQGYVKDANDDWNPIRGDYNGGVFAGPFGGYHERWAESNYEVGPASGGDTEVEITVPAGYLGVVQCLNVYHTDPTARDCYMRVVTSSELIDLVSHQSINAYERLVAIPHLVLAAGDSVQGTALALAEGAEVYVRVWGYKVRL